MAAGLGFKTFTTGEVLTAADTNGYLMQGVLVFASAATRDAAITSPQEGQFAYLKDTNVTTYYTGSAWTNLDTTGMTNPMTTTGDTIYSSSGSTPARLGIGSTGQVLTVAGGIPSWATPAGGGSKVLQVVYAESSSDVTISTTTPTDSGNTATITPTLNTSKILVLTTQIHELKTTTTGNSMYGGLRIVRGSTSLQSTNQDGAFQLNLPSSGSLTMRTCTVMNYLDSPATTSATTYKTQAFCDPTYTIRFGFDNAYSSITLMEIGA